MLSVFYCIILFIKLNKGQVMANATNKLIFSTIVTGFLVSCGGGGSSSTATTDVNQSTSESNTTTDTNTTVTKAGNSSGGGDMSGTGTLTSYTLPSSPYEGEGKRLLAIYMIGSDLERKYGSGTSDFNELVAGYNALSEDAKSQIDVVVAFGGANKSGWKGMKIATMSQIVADSSDGVYGNSGNYDYVANEANMGYKETVKFFLQYLKANYSEHTYKFLDMWDHGSGYGYFLGPDDYYGAASSDHKILHTYDATEVFKAVGLKFDVIGFDTCLNGTMEVAKFSKDYADYLLASEELEPGHGWNYSDVVKTFATATDLNTFGKNLVDSFIDTENHVTSKTLSFVDLSKYTALETNFNKLADVLKGVDNDNALKKALIPTVTNTRGYSVDKEDNTIKTTMDVHHFATLLKSNLHRNNNTDHAAYTLATNVINSAKDYVLYSRQDGTRSYSQGVAVFSMNNKSYKYYGTYERVSDSWYNAINAYVNMSALDTTEPTVTAQSSSTTVNMTALEKQYRDWCREYAQMGLDAETALEYENECLAYFGLQALSSGKYRGVGTSLFTGESNAFINKNSKSKLRNSEATMNVTTATFSDDNIKRVRTVYGNLLDGDFLTTSVIEAKPMMDQNGSAQTYFTPIWNQKWYTFVYEEGKESVWMPLEFKERQSSGNVIYVGEIDYIDANNDYTNYPEDEKFDYARLEVTVDANNKLVSHNIKPYTIEDINGSEQTIFGKTIGEFKVNDQVRFYSQSFDMEADETFFNPEGDFVSVKQAFNLQVEELQFEDDNGTALDYYYVMVAEDVNGNMTFSNLQKAQKDN